MRLSDNVGNTPLLPIKEKSYTILGKAEFMNPSGSVKDRMATYIFNQAEKERLIKPGDVLCEATSGNTGIAFAMLAAERGYTIYIIMPSNMSEERKQMMRCVRWREAECAVELVLFEGCLLYGEGSCSSSVGCTAQTPP